MRAIACLSTSAFWLGAHHLIAPDSLVSFYLTAGLASIAAVQALRPMTFKVTQ